MPPLVSMPNRFISDHPGHSQEPHASSARPPQRLRAGSRGGARGENVVDNNDVQVPKWTRRLERARHVAPPSRGAATRLRGSVAHSHEAVEQLKPAGPRERRSQERSLVEAPFRASSGVERHRDQHRVALEHSLHGLEPRHLLGQPARGTAFAGVLELVNRNPQRPRVGAEARAPVEVRESPAAATAEVDVGTRQRGPAIARGVAVAGELCPAGFAQGPSSRTIQREAASRTAGGKDQAQQRVHQNPGREGCGRARG